MPPKRSDHRILVALEEWAGSSERRLGKLSGHHKEAEETIRRFIKKGLAERVGRLLYPTRLIQEWAVERDRLARRRSRGRAGAERSVTGRRREHMGRHDAGVNELATVFLQCGVYAAPGWKLTINYPNKTQIAPDCGCWFRRATDAAFGMRWSTDARRSVRKRFSGSCGLTTTPMNWVKQCQC